MTFLKPTYVVEHVTDINLEDLKASGIKGLVFDLDNTLMEPNAGQLTNDIAQWISTVKESFKIAVLSNNPHECYIKKASEEIGCPAYAKAGKPNINTAVKVLSEIELEAKEVAMVGDRPLTDIWVGQKLNLTTILVDPLIKHREMLIVKFLRRLERLFIGKPQKTFSAK